MYSQRIRTNVLLDMCRYDQSYMQIRRLILAATIRYMFPAVSTPKQQIGIDRFIAYILSNTSGPQLWARPRRALGAVAEVPPPGERVGERIKCKRSFANVRSMSHQVTSASLVHYVGDQQVSPALELGVALGLTG